MIIKEPKLESRKNGNSFFLLDNYKPGRGIETLSTVTIEPGGMWSWWLPYPASTDWAHRKPTRG